MVRRVGLGIGHLGQHPCAHDALPLGVLGNLVRHIHIQAAAEQPAHAALRVARQPPVFHLRRLGLLPGAAAGCCGAAGFGVAALLPGAFLLPCAGFAALGVGSGPKTSAAFFGADARANSCTFGVPGQQVKTLRLAAGKKVHGEIVAQSGRGRHGIAFVLFGKLHEAVVGLGVDHGVFFNPADLVLFRLDLEKAPPVLQHFERLAVHHLAHPI